MMDFRNIEWRYTEPGIFIAGNLNCYCFPDRGTQLFIYLVIMLPVHVTR